MNRTVDKKKFFHYLTHHPAAVKKLVNPSEDFLAECVKVSFSCIEFIPKEKQTERIVTAYLKTAAKLSLGTVKKFLETNQVSITYFPQATREMWVEAARKALTVDFGEIPEAIVCEELLAAFIKNNCNMNLVKEIPERFWTESLIKTALDTGPDNINNLPKSVVSKKWVLYALNIQVVSDLEIPEKLWDEELAGAAADKTGLDNIPEHLRTKEICLKSIYKHLFDRDAIPVALWKDKDIQMAFACMAKNPEEMIPAIEKPAFQIEALQSAIGYLGTNTEKTDVERLIESIANLEVPDWVPILKLWPEAIKYIQKPDQTTEQILVTLQNRTEVHDLELIAGNLNLAKVTREMAPMLLNVENADVKDFITRKLAPPKRADGAESDEVIVNITPQEYREINKNVPIQA